MVNFHQFRKEVWQFYYANQRDLPWRTTTDPYKILVSELMLQQTQASRVIAYYEDFLKQFPTIQVLASAQLAEVLQIWQGLGYNRRALYLQQAAQEVARNYEGRIPSDIKALQLLPGVGLNTAGAIRAYAFNLPVIFIETNIRKTIIHFFFEDQEKISDKEISKVIEKTLPTENIREWYWALVDYGSQLGRSRQVTNNRSVHYRQQSQFEGSTRQLRSAVLRHLLDEPLSLDELQTIDHPQSGRLPRLLEAMVKEGLITNKDNRYYIS